MNVTINWTPALDAISQQVQYKLSTSGTWLTDPTVLSGVSNSLVISGLTDNVIYDFRIISYCLGGSPANGDPSQQIKINCPSLTIVITDTTVEYSFTAIGGSVTAYSVDLLDNGGVTILQTKTTITGVFTGLTAFTGYNIRVTATAGPFSKVCPLISTPTIATPTCSVPTDITATLS